jgi:putative Holliday junction resolvase
MRVDIARISRMQAERRLDMRALGIDFGERRIGLAISDPEGRLAVPLATVERKSDRSAVAEIAEIARREGVERLVVGEPVGLDGRRGPAAERARGFAERLAERTGLPLTLVDEALTTVEAAARLREAGGSSSGGRRGRRQAGPKGAIDAVAAQILLQEALDGSRGPGDDRPGGPG